LGGLGGGLGDLAGLGLGGLGGGLGDLAGLGLGGVTEPSYAMSDNVYTGYDDYAGYDADPQQTLLSGLLPGLLG
jgi:hypothetical protein